MAEKFSEISLGVRFGTQTGFSYYISIVTNLNLLTCDSLVPITLYNYIVDNKQRLPKLVDFGIVGRYRGR